MRGCARRWLSAHSSMSRRSALRRWWRTRPRWPLSRQIATVFALAMLANAFFIVVALDVYGNYVEEDLVAELPPAAQKAYQDIEAGRVPDFKAAEVMMKRAKEFESKIQAEADFVQNTLIFLAAAAIFALGYIVFGRMGRGLTNIAGTAQRIADGDLTARANMMPLASREEAQLTRDFNHMATSLQRAERELAEGTAAIAHELRTPLTILRGRLHGISDGVFQLRNEEVQGLLYQVEGLGRIVDDLQTLSLANSNRMVLNRENIDLAQEVERVLVATRPDLEAAGLSPMLALASAPLMADGARVRQAVGAVLVNAQRYAPDSGVLRITTRMAQGQAVLEIVDHGPGLPPGVSDQAFDRFWRAEESRGRTTGGSGLGLAVVRAIALAHGGQVTLSNHDGGGTIFVMSLPVGGTVHKVSTSG
jgi:two-component system, OmpR family, sensor histidine kinase AdeS